MAAVTLRAAGASLLDPGPFGGVILNYCVKVPLALRERHYPPAKEHLWLCSASAAAVSIPFRGSLCHFGPPTQAPPGSA